MFRDMSKPYSEEEFAELKKRISTYPSYNPQDETWATSDFPKFIIEDMKFERTPEQLKAIVHYWDNNKGGRIDWTTYVKYVSKLTNNMGGYFSVYVTECDKDNDGFISVDEFEEIHKFVTVYDEKLKDVSFENFLEAADKNQDGKVSVQECVDWIIKVTKGES